jgi:hypothetical protein
MQVRSRAAVGRRQTVALSVIALAVVATVAAVVVTAAQGAARPPVLKAGNPSGIVFAHGAGHGPPPGHGSSQDLLYSGGEVMSGGAAVTPIFWGTGWSNPGDKIDGLNTFYGGVGSSSYLNTTTEYSQTVNNQQSYVSDAVAYGNSGYKFDAGRTSPKAPSTTDVLSVVAATITNPQPNGYYPVYSDQPRGHNNYCAWHSWGTIDNGQGPVLVQFAFFFNLDNDPGCDPQSTVTSQSEGLAALANVSGHELSEALTDPHGDGWYDKQGAENADKCAWTFGPQPLTLSNGSHWKIQGNWSNAVYDAGGSTSYLGAGSGCIDSK